MIKGSEAFQVLKALLKPTLLILIWMTVLRLLLYAAVYQVKIQATQDLTAAFFAGFRFDLLVMGFFWIPIVAVTWASALFMSPRKLFFFWKLYFVIGILIIFDLSWMDLFWSMVSNVRLNSQFFQTDSRIILDQGWKLLGPAKSWICTLGMGFSSLGLVLWLYGLKLEKNYNLPSKAKLGLQVLVSFFLVALAARGTWTAHHLNIEHAQVSADPLVNQIPLNAVWNLDKD
ncbi:MAG: hypothetical protein ACXWC9_03320 [Pseudobdellovibrionaceae bacterium]